MGTVVLLSPNADASIGIANGGCLPARYDAVIPYYSAEYGETAWKFLSPTVTLYLEVFRHLLVLD
jgi:hypothetical protein